jgi:hypothetical protein
MMRISFFLINFLFVGCSGLMTQRTFMDEMSYEDGEFFDPGADFPVVGGDSGRMWRSKAEWRRRLPATLDEKENRETKLLLKSELLELENSLSDYDLDFYDRYKKHFSSHSEKIYFLRLAPGDRRIYLESKGLIENQMKNSSNHHENEDDSLQVGMLKKEVQVILGEPKKVEITGNPIFQNEKWHYSYQGKNHYVYFSAGRVETWE